MDEVKILVDLFVKVEKIKDFLYNNQKVKQVEDTCAYLQTLIERHESIEKLVGLLRIVDEQSYILKDEYTLDEAARYLGISRRQVYRMVESKMLPSYKPSNKNIYIKRKDISEWIDSNKVLSQQEMDYLVQQKMIELSHRCKKCTHP